jgi:UDP-N-acetylglucosamine 3-dehydrogenase
MPLKIAVVGAGSMGSNHLRVLQDFDDESVKLVGVAETQEPALARAVRRFHVAGFADYRRMIFETCPDLVVVVAPTNQHFMIASYALEQGIHVLIEKPIATTEQEALSLIELGRRQGATIAVGHVERFNPAVIALKQLIASGDLGQIFSLHARRIGPYPPRIRDVGVTLDLATHDLDAMRSLIGVEVERVYAETQRRIEREHEDLLFGIVRFANGAVGMLDVNWITPTKVRELSVTGERGMYLANYLTQELYFYENDYTPTSWDALRTQLGVSEGTMTRLKVQKVEPLRAEYEDIIAALQSGRSPTVTAEDGLAILRLAHRLIGSTRVGEAVTCNV